MSDDSSADVADDEDFFDVPSNRRDAEQRPSLISPDGVTASSSYDRSHSRGSNDKSTTDHSSNGKRRTSVEKESRDRRPSSSSVRHPVVIPLPSDTCHDDEDHVDDLKTAEGGSTEDNEPVQDQPPRYKKRNKKHKGESKAKTVDRENKNHGKKNSIQGNLSPHSKSGYASDEEKRHLEADSHSRRSVSSASGSQQLGKCKISRAISAPVRRPQQSRPVSRFSSDSRMDVKMLLDSLLHAENSRRRRRSVADPVEFRRRRNFTFSDERMETIERENKRLLEKIATIHDSEPTYSRACQIRTTPVKPTVFPDIARIKQLEKIEKENLV